jgi:hypothetical protein
MAGKSSSSNIETFVILNGGLGNQLFQLSRGIYLNPHGVIHLNQSIGQNRKNKENVEIFSFILPANIKKDFKRNSNIFSKAANKFLLHRVIATDDSVIEKIIEKVSFEVVKYSQSILSAKKWKLLLGKGSGYDQKPVSSSSNYVLVGYFQSWRWFDSEINTRILKSIQPADKSKRYLALAESAKNQQILMIHIRIGDYKIDKEFGILTKSYYENSIKRISADSRYDECWVFSDSIEEARIMLMPFLKDFKLRFVSDEVSTAESFELLRYGSAYIIANSTFSWWAAQLSYSNNPIVIAPKKWFEGMPDPQDICPPHWIRM